jgi:hypothetical protein
MRHNRYFFMAVIGAILAVLAILAVILLVEGDNEDQGDDTGPSPQPDSAPRLVVISPAAPDGLAPARGPANR